MLIVSGENGRSTHVDQGNVLIDALQDVQWQYAGAHAPTALANSKMLVLITLLGLKVHFKQLSPQTELTAIFWSLLFFLFSISFSLSLMHKSNKGSNCSRLTQYHLQSGSATKSTISLSLNQQFKFKIDSSHGNLVKS